MPFSTIMHHKKWNLLLFSHPVLSNSLWPHGLQHARPPCPSPSPEVCPSSCSLHWWCFPVISASDVLFSFCPQSFPASGSFLKDHLFASDDQNTGASVLPVIIQCWFPLGFSCLIPLLSRGLSKPSPAAQFEGINSKPDLSCSSFTLIKRLFSSSLISVIRVVSSAYLMLLFLLPILIPACNSSSPEFLIMCSAYRLNKQGDSRQPAVLLSQSWTNQLFHTGFKLLLLDLHTGFSGDR